MVRTRLTHFRLAEDAVLPGYLALSEFGTNLLHVPFSYAARWHKFEMINWPQSFARKGLDASRFTLQLQSDPLRFEFTEKPEGIEGGRPAQTVSFERRVRFDSALQGDLIVGAREELALPVELLGDAWVEFPDSFSTTLGRRFHTQKGWLVRAIKELGEGASVRAIQSILFSWSDRSFVRAESSASF